MNMDNNTTEVLQRCKSQLELQKLKIFNTGNALNLSTSPERLLSAKKKNSANSIGSMKSPLMLVKQNSIGSIGNEPMSA